VGRAGPEPATAGKSEAANFVAVTESQPQRACALTMARDEGRMLRRWVDHYGRQLGYDRLLVIDDNSTDGSTDDLPCTVYRLPQGPPRESFGQSRTVMLSRIAAGLLEWHDVAIFTDVDEFLVPDPARFSGLPDYLAARADREVCAPLALNVLHVDSVEGPLDLDKPIIGQRRYAKFVARMCKPSVKRVPARWSQEGHAIAAQFRVDPDLYMFHLKFADRDALQEVADRRHAAFATERRGQRSSWRRSGDELSAMWPEFLADADPQKAPEFRPRMQLRLGGIVKKLNDNVWGPPPSQQLEAMRRRPLVRIPERFYGTV